jgi:phage gp46-like protein
MTQPIDVKLIQDDEGIWDISLDENGQLVLDEGFETTVRLSLVGERRATSGEVSTPEHRGGWIGNLLADVAGFEQGSKNWILRQSRLTDETTATAKNYSRDALNWMTEDGLANTIEVTAIQNGSRIIAEINIDGSPSFFDVWNNTIPT